VISSENLQERQSLFDSRRPGWWLTFGEDRYFFRVYSIFTASISFPLGSGWRMVKV
jgi:hypothetical protein